MPQSNGAFRFTYSWNRFMRLLLIAFVFVISTSVLFFWFLPDRSEVSHLENQLRSQILRLSRDYVSVLSNKQSALSDGPYTADNTAYDLKKTLSVLLNDMMQRMKVLETEVHSLKHANNVISSSPLQQNPLQQSHVRRNIQSVDFVALLQGVQENCIAEADRLLAYPECRSKMEWLRTMWKSDSCYANLGVDGTDCSIIRYLSEIEDYCPTIEQRRIMLQCPRANVNYDLDALLQLIPVDDSHQPSRQFIRDRLKRLWPQLVDGMREYAYWNEKEAPLFMNQPGDYPCHRRPVRATDYYDRKDRRVGQPLFHNRPKLRIHLHLGFISLTASKLFETSIGRGGPLGELVQWTDLLAGLYMLGHNVTISFELSSTLRRFRMSEFGKSSCQFERSLIDLVFTDIVGYRQLTKTGRLRLPPCKYRLLDSFGTEAQFNRANFSVWGNLRLNLQQFYTLFPHSPDNTFLGFVAEVTNTSPTSYISVSGKPLALVYGKQFYMWKDVESYLLVLNETFELHGNVVDLGSHTLPGFVQNHGVTYGTAYLDLLKSVQVMIGLGFPYEGPAPVEAISNGVIFINPRFQPPHGRSNTPFFADKPTNRSLTSQNPYFERYVGEPYSYLVDMHNATQIRETVHRLVKNLKPRAYRPFEFTATGYIERLNALLVHQTLCEGSAVLDLLQSPYPSGNDNHQSPVSDHLDVNSNIVTWPPPLTSLRVVQAPPGLSCTEACATATKSITPKPSNNHLSDFPPNLSPSSYILQRSQVVNSTLRPDASAWHCAPEHFTTLNNRYTLDNYFGLTCTTVSFQRHPLAPFYNLSTHECVMQADRLWFDCTAHTSPDALDQASRLCPCRDALPGQLALCADCV
ncbi:hypothetical protein P879_02173 [Paragonimus westermani]|uniref:alpha-1,6-mannosyl-glycoprotein 6-beta-N-acetylglucosaminyltransferase n=1 Tax=Paragonimus westermani TaxID=34504 RepID=A0A8T0DXB4_9TREM|nr:hypothetical protein P879_02173 [Paragonimus westermani]